MATRRYCGDLIVEVEIHQPEHHETETHWYRMRTWTKKSKSRLDPFVRYYTDVHLSLGEREKLSEDNPRCFDSAARFALSFADE